MFCLLIVCVVVLVLVGCEKFCNILIIWIQVNGVDMLYSKVIVVDGEVCFQCIVSSSGVCYYLVFDLGCSFDVVCVILLLCWFVVVVCKIEVMCGLFNGFCQCVSQDLIEYCYCE